MDLALYRLSQPRLARAIHNAARSGVRVRVILDRQKYELTPAAQQLLARFAIPYRLMSGRRGRYAKMHHKFAVLDGRTALTGSYNWTEESEENN
jgi:phosphatidylserine/phosphatidylglycerophosphate/cardiolipin synthase-like enzyme